MNIEGVEVVGELRFNIHFGIPPLSFKDVYYNIKKIKSGEYKRVHFGLHYIFWYGYETFPANSYFDYYTFPFGMEARFSRFIEFDNGSLFVINVGFKRTDIRVESDPGRYISVWSTFLPSQFQSFFGPPPITLDIYLPSFLTPLSQYQPMLADGILAFTEDRRKPLLNFYFLFSDTTLYDSSTGRFFPFLASSTVFIEDTLFYTDFGRGISFSEDCILAKLLYGMVPVSS